MNRSTTNFIRFCLDELVPPIIRDSRWFMYPLFYFAYRGKKVGEAMNFKKLVYSWSEEEYANFYKSLDTISRNRETDLNQACIEKIVRSLGDQEMHTVLDVGCGNGFLSRKIAENYPDKHIMGVDIKTGQNSQAKNITWHEGNIDALPFEDNSVDVCVCTHVLEHCINLDLAINELKRVARKKIIVVVPKQRYYFYTLDEHVNFFWRKEQLLFALKLAGATCENTDGDWYYEAAVVTS